MRVVSALLKAVLPEKPIMKQYFGRIWFGFGVQSTRTRRIERAWLQVVHPPYYRGTGVALRLGEYSLRVGTMRANSTYLESEESGEVDVKSELVAVGWQQSEMEAEVIGSWESSASRQPPSD